MTQAPLSRRIIGFAVILLGTLFYCYNFNVVDYVRPYLISRYGFSVAASANLGLAQNVGVTVGAFAWAALVVRLGHRATTAAITAAMGVFALLLASAGGYAAWFVGRGLLAATLGGFSVVTTTAVVGLFPIAWRGRLVALAAATYPLSNIMLGTLGGWFGDAGWHLLLWVAVAPLLIAPLALLIPDVPIHAPPAATQEGGWREMLSPRWRWRTLGCTLLSGIDFNAYQLFAAFFTLYLRQEHHWDAAATGRAVSLLSAGSLVGAFFWAWVSDRMGRRWAALGYVTAGVAIGAILFGGSAGGGLDLLAVVFGFGLACNSAWGAWFAELFPDHLRPHGAALFHAGHIIAMAAPLFVTLFVGRYGLVATMAVAAPIYFVGAALWAMLPETIGRRTAGEPA